MFKRLLFSKSSRRIAAYQRELIETQYAEVDNMYQTMRQWRHDLAHHLQTLKAYADAGDMPAIQAYLRLLDVDLTRIDGIIKTGNKMTDAILNSKISIARVKGIPVTVDAQIPIALSISELDLCVIIGNLFDNAIEANLSLPEEERMIRIYMDMKNTQLYMSFTNHAAGKKKEKRNGRFFTTKGAGHGLGLIHIDEIVEKYGGYISCNSEDGAFTTEILLPQI